MTGDFADDLPDLLDEVHDSIEFLSRVPGCYLFVGGALAVGTSGMHHSPDFAVDDGALRIQAGVLAASAVALGEL
ncbi:MAG: hypothetical protein WCA31_02575 [Acidimicrobiales bacterium]